MRQSDYETIIQCIQHGAPAIANTLVNSFNETISLANDRMTYLQEQERIAAERAQAEAVAQAEKEKRAQAAKK